MTVARQRRIALIYAPLGDFKSYSQVPYLIEYYDEISKKRKVYHNFFESFYSTFALADYVREGGKHEAVQLTLFVPLTLMVSRTFRDYESRFYKRLCSPCLAHEAAVYSEQIEASEVVREAIRLLGKKIRDTVSKENERSFIGVLDNLFRSTNMPYCDVFGCKYVGSDNNNIQITLKFIPIPLSLTAACSTSTCTSDLSRNNIVSFRLSNAAERLVALISLIVAKDVIESIRNNIESIDIFFDITHGFNYVPAAFSTALNDVIEFWLHSLREILQLIEGNNNEVTFRLSLYNSDPVFPPILTKESGAGYKMHLVRYVIIGSQDWQPLGYTQLYAQKIIPAMRRLYKSLSGQNVLQDLRDKLGAVAAASLGLPFQLAYLLASLMHDDYNGLLNDLTESESLLIPRKLEVKSSIKNNSNVIAINYIFSNSEYRIAEAFPMEVIHLDLILANLKLIGKYMYSPMFPYCIRVYEKSNSKALERGMNIKLAHYNISKDEFEKIFLWLTKVSRIILVNELVKDKGDVKYVADCSSIDERNFIAHAGLSRGAITETCFMKKDDTMLLYYAEFCSKRYWIDLLLKWVGITS